MMHAYITAEWNRKTGTLIIRKPNGKIEERKADSWHDAVRIARANNVSTLRNTLDGWVAEF